LESSSLTLYDDEHNTLPMPAVPERPPYEKPGTRPARAGGT
jgi:hypothetical protein